MKLLKHPLLLAAAGVVTLGAGFFALKSVKTTAPATPAPATPAPPAKVGGSVGLPTFEYEADLNPVGNGETYNARNVSNDVNALRFLGFTTLTPYEVGGGAPPNMDKGRARGPWHPGFRLAVNEFQASRGLKRGLIGPKTRAELVKAVARQNEKNKTINENSGAVDSQFADVIERARFRRARINEQVGA